MTVPRGDSDDRHENRGEWLAATLVELADPLVDEFDMVDFLSLLAQRCVELFGAVEAGLMLADPRGHLRYMASSSERANPFRRPRSRRLDGGAARRFLRS